VEDHHNPDFSDLRLKHYFSPDLVLPFQIRRGCVYGKCLFCEHPVFMEQESKSRNNPKILSLVQSISNLLEKNQTNNLFFIDEMILPNEMDQICSTINQSKLAINFIFYSYFSNALLKEGRLQLWKEAGLKKMWMGLESFDENVLKKMEKHRPNDSVEQCLSLFKEHDLPVHLFLLLGFPGETPESLEYTINKLISYEDKLKNPFFSFDLFAYTVYINSQAYKLQKKLEIECYEKGDLDIGIIDWKLKNGLNNQAVQDFIKVSQKKLLDVYGQKHNNSVNLMKMNCLQDSTHLLYINHQEKILS
ncbi:radical SAM protein, partial [bacterium]|nr:radical SAM protein [bacterium]